LLQPETDRATATASRLPVMGLSTTILRIRGGERLFRGRQSTRTGPPVRGSCPGSEGCEGRAPS
jgi:hypothetical protein